MRATEAPNASKTRSGGCGWPTGIPLWRSTWNGRRALSQRSISRRPRASSRYSSPLTRLPPPPGRRASLKYPAGESARAIHVIAGERQRIERRAFLAGEYLVDVHPLFFEAVRAAGEIDLPDAVALVPGGRDRPLPVLLQALGALAAGQRVMTPHRLGV